MQRVFAYEELEQADLIIDALYRGGSSGNAGDDPINRLLRVGNMGGFRFRGTLEPLGVSVCVLYSDLGDSAWPDELDPATGALIYYGDNKRPGHELHPGSRNGNALLRSCFELVHRGQRLEIPPFLVFTKAGTGRDVVFRGLAVPGGASTSQTEDLVAIWKSKASHRFQNYRALFTVLDIAVVRRSWIECLLVGGDTSIQAPTPWLTWRQSGLYQPLSATPARRERTREQQLPSDDVGVGILKAIHKHCHAHAAGPFAFEAVAAEIVRLMDKNVGEVQLTRPWRDGGRDGLGAYLIGPRSSRIEVEFAIEAKCYKPTSSVGVRETSRLISRLRHRQFGVLVTTSFLDMQAYKELVEDGHPVLVLAGVDVVAILKQCGIATIVDVSTWVQGVTGSYTLKR